MFKKPMGCSNIHIFGPAARPPGAPRRRTNDVSPLPISDGDGTSSTCVGRAKYGNHTGLKKRRSLGAKSRLPRSGVLKNISKRRHGPARDAGRARARVCAIAGRSPADHRRPSRAGRAPRDAGPAADPNLSVSGLHMQAWEHALHDRIGDISTHQEVRSPPPPPKTRAAARQDDASRGKRKKSLLGPCRKSHHYTVGFQDSYAGNPGTKKGFAAPGPAEPTMQMLGRTMMMFLLLSTAGALEIVHVVAARGRPIGPPNEQDRPETASPGATGVAVEVGEKGIPGSRAEFLMSSPPSDLPSLRDSAANTSARTNAALAGILSALRVAVPAAACAACALLVLRLRKRATGNKSAADKNVSEAPTDMPLKAQGGDEDTGPVAENEAEGQAEEEAEAGEAPKILERTFSEPSTTQLEDVIDEKNLP